MIGKTLAHYEISGLLGKGGMGEVYRARDTKLERDVAIKVLPREMSGDPERIARFRREARTLATLQHTNVASIYGFEDTPEARFLVMELIEGEDLEARLDRGPVAVDEAVDIARQIASGLEAAHEQGIVHRDLKPANIKFASDGQIKILDFGLARAYHGDSNDDVDPAHSPTITAAMTQAGVVLGTAAYMSPEQARGKRIDRRADIWAFGVIVFEMLSGTRLFAGETVSDTLAGVLKTEIDVSQLPGDCPPRLKRLVDRCLDRNASTRLRDIGEARVLLETPLAQESIEPGAAPTRRVRSIAIGGFAGLVLGAALMQFLAPRAVSPVPEREVRFSVERTTGTEPRSALSPDGSQLLYVSGGMLQIREFRSAISNEVQGSEGAIVCAWSPDGEWIAYATLNALHKSRPDGGNRSRLCEFARDMHPLAGGVGWTADGRVVYTLGDAGLMSVAANGGDPRILLAPADTETDFHHIGVLPDNRGFLFHVHEALEFDTVHVFDGTARHEVLRMEGQILNGVVYGNGHLIFDRRPDNAGIWAAPFSLEALEVTGDPFLVIADSYFPTTSNAGDLAYAPNTQVSTQVVQLDERGIVTREVGGPIEGASALRVSPDGREALILIEEATSGLWIIDLETGERQRYIFSKQAIALPSWSPSGDRILYSAGAFDATLHQEIRTRNGTTNQEISVRGQGPMLTRDQRYMVLSFWDEANDSGIGYVDLENPDEPPVVIADTPFAEELATLSPDDRFVAYTTFESGQREIMVRSFPDGEGMWQISSGGATNPFWSPSSDRLYFSNPDGEWLMVVDVSTNPVKFSAPRRQFQIDDLTEATAAPDGSFYALRRLRGSVQATYAIWLGWAIGLNE